MFSSQTNAGDPGCFHFSDYAISQIKVEGKCFGCYGRSRQAPSVPIASSTRHAPKISKRERDSRNGRKRFVEWDVKTLQHFHHIDGIILDWNSGKGLLIWLKCYVIRTIEFSLEYRWQRGLWWWCSGVQLSIKQYCAHPFWITVCTATR